MRGVTLLGILERKMLEYVLVVIALGGIKRKARQERIINEKENNH